ncbi:MAG: glycosyltransferase [Pyrinomonadaceae bacterium]
MALTVRTKLLAKRMFVWVFGSILRAVASGINFTGRLIDFAKKHGLDMHRVWNVKSKSDQITSPPFDTADFLFLMREIAGTRKGATETGSRPVCSIIIPVFNKADYTFQCLRSLFRHVDLSKTEIIVVDNASTDETHEMLAFLGDAVKVVSNKINLGFVDGCNSGVEAATGKYLVFLNNDTLVLANWLDNLVSTIENDETVGAVGSMLIYPDGQIQEAGGIVWRNGNALHYGRLGHPDDSRFNYAREVDYCSGASLLVRKDMFDKLGGFDTRFAPAYYEDTDLCMGIRTLGYKVIYQPTSRVIHFEGISYGTDVGVGLKRFQKINHPKFCQKWRDVLEKDHIKEAPENIHLAVDRGHGLRILVSDQTVPTGRHAGTARMLELLKILGKYGRVVFSPLDGVFEPKHATDLHRTGIQIVHNYHLRSLLEREKFDLAILSRPEACENLFNLIRRHSPKTKIIFDTVDINFVRLGREFELTKDPETQKKAARYKRIESGLARECDQVWCVTESDKEFLLKASRKAKIRIIPTIHNPQSAGLPFSDREGLLFVGIFSHKPNTDAMLFYKEEILPNLRILLPGVKMYIAGGEAPQSVWDMNSENVEVLGFVPDLEALLNSSRVFICPLRYGAGIKGKVGQSLSHGLPVVTTTIGAEGMGLTHEQEVLIEDDPEKFAALVAKLYNDENLWQSLSSNGRSYVDKRFSSSAVEKSLLSSLAELGVPAALERRNP